MGMGRFAKDSRGEVVQTLWFKPLGVLTRRNSGMERKGGGVGGGGGPPPSTRQSRRLGNIYWTVLI